jgi:hypothetical protein
LWKSLHFAGLPDRAAAVTHPVVGTEPNEVATSALSVGSKGEDAMAEEKKQPKLNPGDAAKPGTPGTGENVCPECKGSGRVGNAPCQNCGGTGVVIEGLAGG